jgi:HPt (histidine-containing phosphotransfer) domain-containing protein
MHRGESMVSIGLSIFIIFILYIIFREYNNEKKYQEQRHKKHSNYTKKADKTQDTPTYSPEIVETAPKKIQPSSSLPKADYPQFTHQRLVEMGLSNDEAKAFVQELIPQLEIQIPLIHKMLHLADFHQMERLTHSIKGSATNIGTGGVSDLLVAFNTYLKKGTDIDIAKAYFEHLKQYTEELKVQYS